MELGLKVKKVRKQVRDQRNSAQVLLENENKSSSICYPYSDCGYLADVIAVRIGIANALGFIFIF